MLKNYFLFLLFAMAAFTNVNAQDAPVLTFDLPAQNNLRYNRFLINPAYSFVREDETYVTAYHRNQWIQFDDSPKVYLLSYSGRFSETAGFGIGIYQQNLGVISSFGGVGNYAYNIRLMEKMNLTLGFNVAYYSSGVNKNRVVTGDLDPVLQAMRNNSLVSIKPGLNLSYGNFDLGVYAENFIEYDFKSNEMVKEYSEKKYSGLLMYTHYMKEAGSLLEGGMFRFGAGGRMSEANGLKINANFMIDFPRIGWLQTSLDDYYGVGIGAGFHFTKKLSLGYAFERTLKPGLVNLGPTHELTLAFTLTNRKQEREMKQSEHDTIDVSFEEIDENDIALADETTEKDDFDKEGELEKLKAELDPEDKHLLYVLLQEDSLNNVRKAEFEKKVKNLKEYAARAKEARKSGQQYVEFEGDSIKVASAEAHSPVKPTKESDAKVENDVKNYYSKKTKKPRKTLQKLNKLTIDGAETGYYLIANVFSTQENADKFIRKLRSKGFKDANYFINQKNNRMYVYLKMHSSWREALIDYYSNVNNTYFDTIWIGSVNF